MLHKQYTYKYPSVRDPPIVWNIMGWKTAREESAGGQLGKRLLMTDVKLSNSVSSDDIFVANIVKSKYGVPTIYFAPLPVWPEFHRQMK